MNQLNQESNRVYSVDFPVLVAGISPADVPVGTANAPFYFGQSQILGISATINQPAGQAGNVSISQITPAVAVGVPQVNMRLKSTSATDVGVYRIFWTNTTVAGGLNPNLALAQSP
jgi:hypothetical protein